MSTVFYGYKVEEQNLWEVLDRIRDYYKRTHFIYRIKVDPVTTNLEDDNIRHEFLLQLRKTLDDKVFMNQVEVDLQLFQFDDYYIFRVLESGYQFMNEGYADVTVNESSLLEPVFYDTRADMSEKDELNKTIVDEIEKLIEGGYYFIAPIVNCDTGIYWNYFQLLQTPEGRQSMYSTNVPLSEKKE